MISAANQAFVDRRRQMARDHLGGVCVVCGTTEELEFDHIDSTTKLFTISANFNRRWEVLVEELDKCQLLCHQHHREKTVQHRETGGGHNKSDTCPHGTLWGYSSRWKCRCDLCRAAKAAARRKSGAILASVYPLATNQLKG